MPPPTNGVVFQCNNETVEECVHRLLLGTKSGRANEQMCKQVGAISRHLPASSPSATQPSTPPTLINLGSPCPTVATPQIR